HSEDRYRGRPDRWGVLSPTHRAEPPPLRSAPRLPLRRPVDRAGGGQVRVLGRDHAVGGPGLPRREDRVLPQPPPRTDPGTGEERRPGKDPRVAPGRAVRDPDLRSTGRHRHPAEQDRSRRAHHKGRPRTPPAPTGHRERATVPGPPTPRRAARPHRTPARSTSKMAGLLPTLPDLVSL